MGNPKLQFKDKYVGIRHIGDNIYVPKNNTTFESTIYNIPRNNAPLVVVTYFQNNSDIAAQYLSKIAEDMAHSDWTLIVIDNGSTDKTWDILQSFNPGHVTYLPIKLERTFCREELRRRCMSISQEYVNDDSFIKIIDNPNIEFKRHDLKSFCFMATQEVVDEAVLLVYSIRAFHDLPIYIVCDDSTKTLISKIIDCTDIHFECSANKKDLQDIKVKYKKEFKRCGSGYHRMECLYQKIRAMEFALENESNTLFVDSDIVILDAIDDPLYEDIILSPHYWGARPHFGIYNAGYIFSAEHSFVQYWREAILKKSRFLEQEGMNHICETYDVGIFSKDHNIGFWRVTDGRQLHSRSDTFKSFHLHCFTDIPYKDVNSSSDITSIPEAAIPLNDNHNRLKNMFFSVLSHSRRPEHKTLFDIIQILKTKKYKSLPEFSTSKMIYGGWGSRSLPGPVKSSPDGKLNLKSQISFSTHRSGWKYAVQSLYDLHNEDGILFDGFLENNFGWTDHRRREIYNIPWVGFFHNPPNIPGWFMSEFSIQNLINTDEFRQSIEYCKGIYTLSEYHAKYVRKLLDVPVNAVLHPTKTDIPKFNFDAFKANENKKLINIGYWLRRLSSIYELPLSKSSIYEKWRLIPYTDKAPQQTIQQLLSQECLIHDKSIDERYSSNTKTIERLSNQEYDDALTKNIVFLDLYDSSANNAVIECIARYTPILINPIPAVIEYLGIEYPFYFNTLDEAAAKCQDIDLVNKTHLYLKEYNMAEKLTREYFKKSVTESGIYKSLNLVL